jgi:hypothetical protein
MSDSQTRFIYTKHKHLTEQQFLFREFKLQTITSDDLVKDCWADIQLYGNCLIATPDPLALVNEINLMPKSSVVVFLLGNETYIPEIFNCLNNCAAIKWAFIYNLPTDIYFKTSTITFLGDVIDSGIKEVFGSESSLRDFLISRSLRKKMMQIEINYPHSRFPQGYSNNFAFQLHKLNFIDDQESVLESKSLSAIRAGSNRTIFLNFIGQLTNRRRRKAIEIAASFSGAFIKITSGFGGSQYTNSSYLEAQLNSKFCLVPPGYFNNQNHRYLESLTLGTLPLILCHNSIDPSENQNWTKKLNVFQAHSFKLLIKFALKVSENERQKVLESEFAKEVFEIVKVREALNSLIN